MTALANCFQQANENISATAHNFIKHTGIFGLTTFDCSVFKQKLYICYCTPPPHHHHQHHHHPMGGRGCLMPSAPLSSRTPAMSLSHGVQSPPLSICWGVHSHHHCPSVGECIVTTTVPLLRSAVTITVPAGECSHHHCSSAGECIVTTTVPLLGSA